MADENPYNAPEAALASGVDELYEPSIFSFNGRLGRLRYLAYGVGVNMLLMLIMLPVVSGMAFVMSGNGLSMLGIVLIATFYIASIFISVMFGKRRLNDLDRSGWWFLLFIVPILNLVLAIYMLFFPGTDGSNKFGSAPAANSTGVKILAWILPVIFIVGIAAAIAIPAYQQYMMMAQ